MHGITVIRIDCAYPIFRERYEYIKNNILSSKLKDIINLQDISFERANKSFKYSFFGLLAKYFPFSISLVNKIIFKLSSLIIEDG